MPFIEELGMQAAGQAASGIIDNTLGLATQGIRNKQQLKQQRKLQNMALEGHYAQSQFDQQMALDTWEKTNYAAQREQMEKAGLSPGLMYGMKGGGGASLGSPGGSPGMAHAESAPAMGGTPGMGLNLPLVAAQVENIKADTELKKADAAKTAGADTKKTMVETESILADVKNKATENDIMQLQKAFDEIRNSVSRQTILDQMNTIEQGSKAATELVIKMKRENKIGNETEQAQINQIKAESIGQALENILTEAQTKGVNATTAYTNAKASAVPEEIALIRQQRMGIINQISLGWQNMNINERKQALSEMVTDYSDIPQPLMEILEQAVDGIMKGKISPSGHTPIKGFGGR